MEHGLCCDAFSWRDVYKVMLQEMIAGRFNPGGGEAICKSMIANIA